MILHPRFARLIQPIGFALFLLYFIIPSKSISFPLFWAGIVFSVAGSFYEIALFTRLPKRKKQNRYFVVISGIIVKLLLIICIALRVYDTKYSVYILLGAIVLAIAWSAFSALYKPDDDENNEILDAPES